MKLLIVDDNSTNLKLLRAQLESDGHAVLQARNGLEGLDLARTQPLDGVVSDILMPDMDGFQFCLEVRRDPALCHLPFVLYTSTYVASADRELAARVGADAYLMKPVPPRQIIDALRQAMRPSGSPPGQAGLRRDDPQVLRQYSEVLVRKLEEKNRELMRANEELEQRVAERTAELENSLQELELFSGAVSHDLRNPLHSMSGLVQIVLETDYAGRQGSEGFRLLSRVIGQTQQMAGLINALLALARSSQGELHQEAVDLAALATEVVEGLRAAEPQRQVQVRIQPGMVAQGDPQLLRAVLDNLLGNAWKYTAQVPAARIEFGQVLGGDARPVYYVRDNGAGFDMRQAARLFEGFQRLHRAAEFPGHGIGLATVRRIVQRHGGRVWADATPGAGATFSFVLGPAPVPVPMAGTSG
jgi:signal transduction histidine kinase